MDRTVIYRELVRLARESGPTTEAEAAPNRPEAEADAFTREATSIATQIEKIGTSLRLLRPSYLALSSGDKKSHRDPRRGEQRPPPMSDAERDDFDYMTRQLLQREQRRVRALEQREAARHAEQMQRGGSLAARWLGNAAAEGVEQTLADHRHGIFFYLNMQLQRTSQRLAEMQGVRLQRGHGTATRRPIDVGLPSEVSQGTKLEKRQPTPAQPAPKAETTEPAISTDSRTDSRTEVLSNAASNTASAELPEDDEAQSVQVQEQIAVLEEEHNAFLEDLNATLDKAQQAEQSLREISELQTELSTHLATQSEQMSSLTSDAFRTTSDISAANKQLERAKKSNRRASRIIIFSSLATGVFLLLLNGR